MKRTFTSLLLASAACVAFTGTANAGLITISNSGTNDCSGDYGTNPTCAIVDSQGNVLSPQIIKYNFETDGPDFSGNINPAFPSIDGSEFTILYSNGDAVYDGEDGGTGTWSYTPGPDDPAVRYWSVKASDGYNLQFFVDDDSLCTTPTADQCLAAAVSVTSGDWTSPTSSLSHIVFFDTDPTDGDEDVPAPATLALLGLGILGLGLRRRRR